MEIVSYPSSLKRAVRPGTGVMLTWAVEPREAAQAARRIRCRGKWVYRTLSSTELCNFHATYLPRFTFKEANASCVKYTSFCWGSHNRESIIMRIWSISLRVGDFARRLQIDTSSLFCLSSCTIFLLVKKNKSEVLSRLIFKEADFSLC